LTPHRTIVHVVEARHVAAHRVWMRLDDGLSGEADLAGQLSGEVFEPLRDVAYFAQFTIAEARTLSWSNGADFAPEFLHDLVAHAAPRTVV